MEKQKSKQFFKKNWGWIVLIVVFCLLIHDAKDQKQEDLMKDVSTYSYTFVRSDNGVRYEQTDQFLRDYNYYPDAEVADELTTMVFNECKVNAKIDSREEQSALVWLVLNRYDDQNEHGLNPNKLDIWKVINDDRMFHSLKGADDFLLSFPLEAEPYRLLVNDVLTRYHLEKAGVKDAGRTLPKDYLYVESDSADPDHLLFKHELSDTSSWDWSLPDPYKTMQNDLQESSQETLENINQETIDQAASGQVDPDTGYIDTGYGDFFDPKRGCLVDLASDLCIDTN